ncbi:MAG: hypothetical protein KGJ11_00280 [Candidatus Omnitrophica bacterium]|nr:hypothetical protein [Candidatus Omnitrophota bacterium]
MQKKLTAITVISIFVFILFTTAWDYWPSKSGHHTVPVSKASFINGSQFKAAPPECHSLHDVYEASNYVFNASPQVSKNVLPSVPVVVIHSFLIKKSVNLYDRPPPLASSPSAVPLFQLYCNLRI